MTKRGKITITFEPDGAALVTYETYGILEVAYQYAPGDEWPGPVPGSFLREPDSVSGITLTIECGRRAPFDPLLVARSL